MFALALFIFVILAVALGLAFKLGRVVEARHRQNVARMMKSERL